MVSARLGVPGSCMCKVRNCSLWWPADRLRDPRILCHYFLRERAHHHTSHSREPRVPSSTIHHTKYKKVLCPGREAHHFQAPCLLYWSLRQRSSRPIVLVGRNCSRAAFTVPPKLHSRCHILVQGLLSTRAKHRTRHGGPCGVFSSSRSVTWSPVMGP